MQATQQVRIVVELVSGAAHLIEVMAVITGGCPLLRPFADDAQLLVAEFGHPGQHFLKIHHASWPGPSLVARRKLTVVAESRGAICWRRC
jgi:hypothetical protein